MGETFLDRHGIKSGIKLNDVIEEFKYVYKGQEVKAGDFVNYINGVASKKDYGESVDTQISAESNAGNTISSVALDDNRVFVAHSYGADYHLYGVVLSINGATITIGTDIALNTVQYSGYEIDTLLLSDGRVFITHSYNGNYNPYATVISINGTTITVDISQQLDGIDRGGYVLSTELLPNGNIFIAHSRGTDYDLYAMVVTVSGNTITVGTDTSLNATNQTGYAISTCLLPNGNVFIAHSYGSSYYLYGMVCSISGTTITKGSDTQLTTTASNVKYISACLLLNGNVFIAYNYGTNYYLYGMVVTINDTAITAGAETEIIKSNSVANRITAFLLPNGNVFVIHNRNESMFYLYGVLVSITDMTITAGTDTQLNDNTYTGYSISCLLLNNGTVFIAHSHTTDYYLNAQIWGIDEENNVPTNHIVITEYEQQVTPAIEPPFNAVALSSGVGGTDTEHNEKVKIARTILLGNLVKNGDFEGGVAGWLEGVEGYTTFSQADNGYSGKCARFEIVQPSTSFQAVYMYYPIPLIGGHKYYGYLYWKGEANNNSYITPVMQLRTLNAANNDAATLTSPGNPTLSTSENWVKSNILYGVLEEISDVVYAGCEISLMAGVPGQTITSGMGGCIDNVRVYDLTVMYGAGNEPTQEWCEANLGGES